MAGTPWGPIPGKSDDAIPVRIRMPEEGESQNQWLKEPPVLKFGAGRESLVKMWFELAFRSIAQVVVPSAAMPPPKITLNNAAPELRTS